MADARFRLGAMDVSGPVDSGGASAACFTDDDQTAGDARQIVEELVDRAQRRGMSAVDVLTDTPWTSATALYRACGFERTYRDATDTSFARCR